MPPPPAMITTYIEAILGSRPGRTDAAAPDRRDSRADTRSHARFARSETGNRVDAKRSGSVRSANRGARAMSRCHGVEGWPFDHVGDAGQRARGAPPPRPGDRGAGDHRGRAAGPCGVACRPRRAGRPHQRRDQALRGRRRRRQHGPRRRPRVVLLVPRPIGLRQDDDPAHDRGLRAADGGRDLPRRRARRGRAALPAPREHRVPALRAVPAHDRRAERRLRAAPEGHQQARRAAPRRGGARSRPARGLWHAPDVGAVGWAAAARRARAGVDQPPDRAPPRRAAWRARPEAPQGDAARAQAAPAGGRDHVRVRDPRPGGGPDHERRHRRHAARPDPAAGQADRALRATGQPLRGQLHRRLEPHHGPAPGARPGRADGASSSRRRDSA